MNRIEKEWLKYRVFTGQGVMLPVHEMAGLAALASGLLVLLSILLATRYGARKTPPLGQQKP